MTRTTSADRSTASVLRDRRYRRLFGAQVIALVGTGLLTVALGLLAYDIAGDDAGAVLGTALAIKMVAYVAISPIIVAATSRLSPKVVMVCSDAIRAATALALPFVDATWQIYLLILVLQAASGTFTPTFQSVIPTILEDEDEDDYTRGLSLSRLAYDLEAVVSPILAAALLTVVTYSALFVGTIVGFIASGLLVVGTALPGSSASRSPEPLGRRITAGARIMVARPTLRGLLALNAVVAAAIGLVVVNTVVYVHDLGGDGTAVALALACFGAGSMVVALWTPRAVARFGDRRIMMSGAVVVVAGLLLWTVALVAAPGPIVGSAALAVLWIALGAGTSLIATPSARLVRAAATPSTRSALFTAQFSLSHACYLVTYPLAGWLGVAAGQEIAAISLTVLATLAAIAAVRLWPAATSDTAPSEAHSG
ncbi:MFS transporter [Millisia brevis]|uniref:MFS transporter n=1 Tax=Millisia brevis TaxID=264148 RepID=UPI0008356537|nr:MFS transporter [Millisia brevis]